MLGRSKSLVQRVSAMEDYPRALMRAMKENPPNARWDFANRNYLTDLECPQGETNAIHHYRIELQRRAWEILAEGQDDQENTTNVSYTQVEGRADREERKPRRAAYHSLAEPPCSSEC